MVSAEYSHALYREGLALRDIESFAPKTEPDTGAGVEDLRKASLNSPEIMLQVNSICKTYTQRPPHVQVLRNINFSMEEGRFVTLLGPSGCGKTTLLTLVGGFHKASAGQIFIKDREIRKPGPDRGFVFQNYALFPWLTVSQNVQYPMKERGMSRAERKKLCFRLLDMAQLHGTENKYPSQLSGGMRQRVAFVRALAGDPDILLLDEPLGAIDPQMRKSLQVELENLWMQDKKTVLMVTHDIDEAVYLSDRVLIMAPCTAPPVTKIGTNLIGDIAVDLPRPRGRKSQEYQSLLRKVELALESIGPAALKEAQGEKNSQ